MQQVDLLILSVSRPDLLQQTVESIRKYVKCDRYKLKWMIHEDFLIDVQSEECIRYALSCEEFEIIDSHRPNRMMGRALDHMLTKHLTTEFCFLILDDCAFIDYVDLDKLLDILVKHERVNCVAFNSYPIPGPPDRLNKTYDFDDQKLTTNAHWVFSNSIWRMSRFRKYFEPAKYHVHWAFNNNMKHRLGWPTREGAGKYSFLNIPAEWIYENQGTYVYGAIGEGPHIQHIGSLRPYSVVAGEGRGALREDVDKWVRRQCKIVRKQGNRKKQRKRYR